MSLLWLAALPLVARDAPVASCLELDNGILTVRVSTRDGSFVSVLNRRAECELIAAAPARPQPWLLLLDGGEFVSTWTGFRLSTRREPGLTRADLRWVAPEGIEVRATLLLREGSDELEIRTAARNRGKRTVIALNYPRFEGIGRLGAAPGSDYLLHSAMGGALVRDPLDLFRTDSPLPQARGFLPARYPNGFAGSPLQTAAYYREGVGGFSLSAEDSGLTDKDINFYATAPGPALACEIAHFTDDGRPGRDLAPPYAVKLAALTEGTWFEPAERYRAWATRQAWCARGTRRERVERGDASRWLLEEIGAVTMWAPFEADIREALSRTREVFGAPMLHLPLRWTNEATVSSARAAGDRLGPFYFPFVGLAGGPAHAECADDEIVPRRSAVVPGWLAMCPAQPEWRALAVRSAADLAGEGPQRVHSVWIDANPNGCAADSLYFDIGPCAGVPSECWSGEHVHRPGMGGDITRAYVSLIEEMQAAATQARGAYVPVGTECLAEPYVGCLDTTYLRSAGIELSMECMPYTRFLTWIPDGRMEVVPLVEFVYHEYGPVAMQGVYADYPWGVPQAEDLWTWGEARATLCGQLVVTQPMYPGAHLSESRRAFLRDMAVARTGFARDFLSYGRMLRTPRLDVGLVGIDHGLAEGGWLRKRVLRPPDPAAAKLPDHGDWSIEEWAGTMATIPSTPATSERLLVPEVLAQAYELDGRLGVLLVSLRSDRPVRVRVPLDRARYGMPRARSRVTLLAADGVQALGEVPADGGVEVEMAPRRFVLLEARPVR